MTHYMYLSDLEKRILEISYKNKLSHLSSNLTAVRIIDEIYCIRKDNDPFILSSGHAGLALYVVLEKYYGLDAEQLYLKHGVHPNRDLNDKIYYSSGSLGCGLPAAIGMALSNKNRTVYCLISDGESFEGSIYESLNVIHQQSIKNLNLFVNLNGYSALEKLNILRINEIMKMLMPKIEIRPTYHIQNKFPFLNGVQGHYHIMQDEEYKKIIYA